jgi:hypothetical protein
MKIPPKTNSIAPLENLTRKAAGHNKVRPERVANSNAGDSVRTSVAPELESIQDAEQLGKGLADRLNLNQVGALAAIGSIDEDRIENLLSDED